MRKSGRLPLNLNDLGPASDIFRLAGAKRRDAAVEAWLQDDSVELRAAARPWFVAMRECGDDVRELIHDGCPVACVGDAAFGYVNTFTRHVNVGFFFGAALHDPAGLLEGSGKRMRHVKLKPDTPVDTDALRDLIEAAYADVKERLSVQHDSRDRH